MEKNLQDLAWACLPKEARDEIRESHRDYSQRIADKTEPEYRITGYLGAQTELELFFGKHNLTSDTEPEEMLMVKRSKVIQFYDNSLNNYQENKSKNRDIATWHSGRLGAWYDLFGDKCLPDKEESVQDEPRFREGVLVKCLLNGEIYEVEGKSGKYHYALKGFDYDVHEDNLEPYTEEDKEMDEALYGKDRVSPTNEDEIEEMEEKELDLSQLLEDFEDIDTKFYSSLFGESLIREVSSDSIDIAPVGNPTERVTLWRNGNFGKYGQCILYPSRTLYEKYPLDAKAAWREWQESRKPKRWRAKHGDKYWFIDNTDELCWNEDILATINVRHYNFGNYFRTEELAQQAAEGIRDYLKSFHEKHKEQ